MAEILDFDVPGINWVRRIDGEDTKHTAVTDGFSFTIVERGSRYMMLFDSSRESGHNIADGFCELKTLEACKRIAELMVIG